MRSAALIISSHRCARFETLARLSLLWIAGRLIAWFGLFAKLSPAAEREMGACLDPIARLVGGLICMRVVAPWRRPARTHRPHALAARRMRPRTSALRAILGLGLRRRFMRGPVSARVAALFDALAHMDDYAAACARRVPRGLTRVRPILARRAASAPLADAPFFARAGADTS